MLMATRTFIAEPYHHRGGRGAARAHSPLSSGSLTSMAASLRSSAMYWVR